MVTVLLRLNGTTDEPVPLEIDLVSPAPVPQQLRLVDFARQALPTRNANGLVGRSQHLQRWWCRRRCGVDRGRPIALFRLHGRCMEAAFAR